MSIDTDVFTPGDYWTAEHIAAARARQRATMAMPQVAAMFALSPTDSGGPPPEMLAMAMGDEPPPSGPVERARCRYRRARAADVPRLARLIAGAELPPLFVEEFINGFVVVDHEGDIVGTGGLEMYDGAGVIRSVVADDRVRGFGFGRRMAELLIEDARMSGAHEVYLFTADALPFWQHIGFEEIGLDDWAQSPRECWQWQYISPRRDEIAGVHTMRIAVTPP